MENLEENEKIKLSERQINGNNIQELREKILFINSMEDINYGALRCVWGKIFKREVIKDIRFDQNIYLLEDGIFLYECMKNVQCFQFIDECLYHYRKVESSACNRFNKDQLIQYDNISSKLLKILSNAQKQLYYKVMLECIMTYISRLMSYSKIEKKEKIRLINNLTCQNKYHETIFNIDVRKLSKKEKITIYLLKNNYLQILYVICKIKDFVKGKGKI